jgi:nitrite reductase/ring-hydroxylating ferredoxin subunit
MRKTSEDTNTIAPDARPMDDQPQWRKDFPIDRSQDEYVARRDFTKFLVLTSAAFAVGQSWIVARDLASKGRERAIEARPIAAADELAVGGSKLFHFPTGADPCILVRTGDNEFVAYSQLCTHLSCPILPDPRDGQLHCPCHNGFFDVATGRPTAGPPKRPLPKIAVEVRNGLVFATGVELRTV